MYGLFNGKEKYTRWWCAGEGIPCDPRDDPPGSSAAMARRATEAEEEFRGKGEDAVDDTEDDRAAILSAKSELAQIQNFQMAGATSSRSS